MTLQLSEQKVEQGLCQILVPQALTFVSQTHGYETVFQWDCLSE